MSGSSFVLTLLLITTVAAATADHPAFWLLLGPAPLAALTGAVVFMRSKAPQRRNDGWGSGVTEQWRSGVVE